MWREDRGWHEVWFPDAQKALGDYAQDLPGGLGLVALPQDVATAVRQAVPDEWAPDGWAPAEPVPWTPSAGYDRTRRRPKTTDGTSARRSNGPLVARVPG